MINQKKDPLKFYTHLNHKGVTLVELLVTMAILMLIGVAATLMIRNVIMLQTKANTHSSLLSFKENLKELLDNERHWQATVNHTSNSGKLNLACHREGPPHCLHNSTSQNFNIIEQSGPRTFFYRRLSPLAGVTPQGRVCYTYGTQNCPFRYHIFIRNRCRTGNRCERPNVEVTANIVKHGGARNPIFDQLDLRPATEGGVYSFRFIRKQNTRYEPFRILNRHLGGIPTSGGGPCPGAGWHTRPLNVMLPASPQNVSLNTATGTFRLRAGTYECTIEAEGYDQVDGFKIRLLNVDTPSLSKIIGSAKTPDNSTAKVIGATRFTINAPSRFRLEHYCTTPSDDLSIPGSDMGRPLPPYNVSSVYTDISCARIPFVTDVD